MAGKNKNKIVVNYAAVGELLKGKEMQDVVKGIASRAAETAGSGYSSDVLMMGTRVIASVYTDSTRAAKDNLENNTLLKAVQT